MYLCKYFLNCKIIKFFSKEKAEDPNELGAKLIKAEIMGDEVKQCDHEFLGHLDI